MSIEIQENVPLASQTTFNIGGSAKYYASVKSDDDLREALTWARNHSKHSMIIAGGSNILVSDKGYEGLVIHIESSNITMSSTTLVADAGCNLLFLIRAAADSGLGGWEKLAGIPGTIGGATRGNAGAFGSEIKDFVRSVEAMHSTDLTMRKFSGEECDFSYRHSFFKDNRNWVITRVTLELMHVDMHESAEKAQATIAEREMRHLQNVKAAGSFFMNPTVSEVIVSKFEADKGVKARENRVPAGWLIEKAGMKGRSVGGAQASMQHPNYIVNIGAATADDVRELSAEIKAAVFEKFGVKLIEEAAIF